MKHLSSVCAIQMWILFCPVWKQYCRQHYKRIVMPNHSLPKPLSVKLTVMYLLKKFPYIPELYFLPGDYQEALIFCFLYAHGPIILLSSKEIWVARQKISSFGLYASHEQLAMDRSVPPLGPKIYVCVQGNRKRGYLKDLNLWSCYLPGNYLYFRGLSDRTWGWSN